MTPVPVGVAVHLGPLPAGESYQVRIDRVGTVIARAHDLLGGLPVLRCEALGVIVVAEKIELAAIAGKVTGIRHSVDALAHLRFGDVYENVPIGIDFEPEQGIKRSPGKATGIPFGQPGRCTTEPRRWPSSTGA